MAHEAVGAVILERAAQANLAVFEDDTLGFAFALGPQWEASSQQLENGGQIIAFAIIAIIAEGRLYYSEYS